MAAKTCSSCLYFDPAYVDEGGVTLACRRHDRHTNKREPACPDHKGAKGIKK